MASQESSSISVSWPGLFALLVAVVGMFVSRPPLVSPRPSAAGGGLPDIAPDHNVAARLWQDPLAAAWRGKEAGGDLAALLADNTRADEEKNKQVLFLFDCLPSGSTAEDCETRRRERYAILSALGTAAYAPLQSDRIHYADVAVKSSTSLSLRIPYEWVAPMRNESNEVKSGRIYAAVCVLWISLLPSPYKQLGMLHQLQGQLLQQCSQKCLPSKCAIAGRIGSTELAAMLRENVNFTNLDPEAVKLYVTCSTSPSARECSSQAKGLTPAYFIGTDKRLVCDLIKELKRRHIDPNESDKNPIAVVAEWDTDYGREMHQLFDDLLSCKSGQPTPGSDSRNPHVHHYSYLRGLDGKVLGGSVEKQKGDETEVSGGELAGSPVPLARKPTAQEGEGESQFDYVRRLGDQMKADHENFKAIAIVGNDVYDKLLLLRALRPSFPNAVFCTTDLDVRLVQLGDFADTRNLVIASHYGISLRKELQGKVAPFRSSYDTASYLGCLGAVDYKPLVKCFEGILKSEPGGSTGLDEVLKNGGFEKGTPVHVYEMSRTTGAYELTLSTQSEDRVGQPNPRLHPWLTRNAAPWLLAAIAVMVGLLLLPVSSSWLRFLLWAATPAFHLFGYSLQENSPDEGSAIWRRWLILAGAALGAILGILIYLAHIGPEQEPFELFEGISIWPTVLLRLLAAELCVYYIAKACHDLSKRNEEIAAYFGFPRTGTNDPNGRGKPLAALYESCQCWFRETPPTTEVSQLHNEFMNRGAPGRRAVRTGLLALVNLLLFVLVWNVFSPTMLQARGEIASICYRVVLVVTLIAQASLLMFVVDSTLLSYRFVAAFLRQERRDWPDGLLDRTAQKWGTLQTGDAAAAADIRQAADRWLFIRYIDDVTNVVARMIYYPFVVLLVLVVAQNRIFEDWHLNVPLTLLLLFNASTVVACAVILQLEAKRAREKSLEVLEDLLGGRTGLPQDAAREKLAQIRLEIKQFRTGAFAGFSQNPIVKAALLPLLGGGGLAALETLLPYLRSYSQ